MLADDYAMGRQKWRSILNEYSDVEVVGEAFDEEEAVRIGGELQPQVAVMDFYNGRITSAEHDVVQYHDTVVIGLSVAARAEN